VPRYSYRCTECEEVSVVFHLSDETVTECPGCSAPKGLVKLLTKFTTARKQSSKPKTGELTEEFIQDARQELDQQKQDLDKNR